MALFDAKSKVIAGYQKSIEDKELKIRQFYDQIGRLYYGQYADINVDVTKEINQRCENITAIKNEIENLEVCILYEKGLKRCPHCRTENGLEYDFCFKCGEKFVVATPEAEVQPEFKGAPIMIDDADLLEMEEAEAAEEKAEESEEA